MHNGGIIERLGLSDHAKYLSDRSQLLSHEVPLAELTIDVRDDVSLPGWLVYNRMTGELVTIHPFGSRDRFELAMHQEAGLDILSMLYSQSVH